MMCVFVGGRKRENENEPAVDARGTDTHRGRTPGRPAVAAPPGILVGAVQEARRSAVHRAPKLWAEAKRPPVLRAMRTSNGRS